MAQVSKWFDGRFEIPSVILKVALTVSLIARLAAQGIVPDPAPLSLQP